MNEALKCPQFTFNCLVSNASSKTSHKSVSCSKINTKKLHCRQTTEINPYSKLLNKGSVKIMMVWTSAVCIGDDGDGNHILCFMNIDYTLVELKPICYTFPFNLPLDHAMRNKFEKEKKK